MGVRERECEENEWKRKGWKKKRACIWVRKTRHVVVSVCLRGRGSVEWERGYESYERGNRQKSAVKNEKRKRKRRGKAGEERMTKEQMRMRSVKRMKKKKKKHM